MIKIPFFNNHICEGIYGLKQVIPHYCWIPHAIFGILSIWFPIIILFFVVYQISQIFIKKGHHIWDEIVDLIEFFIARYSVLLLFFILK
jgi:hypothetical protein